MNHEPCTQAWNQCFTPEERIEFIREHPDEFEFLNFADLLAAIRGRYWSGTDKHNPHPNNKNENTHT